jgi:hypothetical protein
MSETIPDLWPTTLTKPVIRTPLAILREQGEFLARKTEGLLRALVRTTNLDGTFVHVFYLHAPALDDYTYRLFEVRHPIQFYPLTITADRLNGRYEAASERELMDYLRTILGAEPTLKVIGALLAQSEAQAR